MKTEQLENVKITTCPQEFQDDVPGLINRMLPSQGSIEVQKDCPDKYHSWHRHDIDETLVILKGGLTFYYYDQVVPCSAGQIIYLPKNILHASMANQSGAVYLIARELIWLD